MCECDWDCVHPDTLFARWKMITSNIVTMEQMLHVAICNHDIEECREILKTPGIDALFALVETCRVNSWDMFQLVYKHQPDIEDVLLEAIMWAFDNENVDILRVLMRSKECKERLAHNKDMFWYVLMQNAIKGRRPKIVHRLLPYCPYIPTRQLVVTGNLEILELGLTKMEFPKDVLDACEEWQPEILRYFLSMCYDDSSESFCREMLTTWGESYAAKDSRLRRYVYEWMDVTRQMHSVLFDHCQLFMDLDQIWIALSECCPRIVGMCWMEGCSNVAFAREDIVKNVTATKRIAARDVDLYHVCDSCMDRYCAMKERTRSLTESSVFPGEIVTCWKPFTLHRRVNFRFAVNPLSTVVSKVGDGDFTQEKYEQWRLRMQLLCWRRASVVHDDLEDIRDVLRSSRGRYTEDDLERVCNFVHRQFPYMRLFARQLSMKQLLNGIQYLTRFRNDSTTESVTMGIVPGVNSEEYIPRNPYRIRKSQYGEMVRDVTRLTREQIVRVDVLYVRMVFLDTVDTRAQSFLADLIDIFPSLRMLQLTVMNGEYTSHVLDAMHENWRLREMIQKIMNACREDMMIDIRIHKKNDDFTRMLQGVVDATWYLRGRIRVTCVYDSE